MALEGDEKKAENIKPGGYAPFLTKPSSFLVVQHDALNDPYLNLERVAEDSFAFGRYIPGRSIVPVCEGDLFMLEETGDLVLTHQNLGG